MGVSYEISRREGILGGPEKPISNLGRKGYKRFWAGEVARWILSLETSTAEGEVIVDIDDCSKATWIMPEDCLLVLREMGIAKDAGMGPPKADPDAAMTAEGEEGDEKPDEQSQSQPQPQPQTQPQTQPQREVRRVNISKAAVRQWVATNRINLERTCDPDGFVEGYAVKEPTLEECE